MDNEGFHAQRVLVMQARIEELEKSLKEALKLLKDSTDNFDRIVEILGDKQ